MKPVLLFLAIALFVPQENAFGGAGAGNGGHGVGCRSNPSGEITKVTIHDYYEGKYRYRFEPNLGEKTLSVEQKVNLVLDRVDHLDPERADRYRNKLKVFWENTNMWPDARLVFIPDSNYVGMERGCELVQVAIQKKAELPKERFYTIDEDYWKLMDPDSQAGLILHEIIYEEFLSLGATDSTNARYYNALISSDDLTKMTLPEYVKTMEALALPIRAFRVNGTNFKMEALKFYPDGAPKAGKLSEAQPFQIKSAHFNSQDLELQEGSTVEFYPNGLLKIGSITGEGSITSGTCEIGIEKGDQIELSMDGDLETIRDKSVVKRNVCIPFENGKTENLSMRGLDTKEMKGQHELHFFPTGVVRSGILLDSLQPDADSNMHLPPQTPPVDRSPFPRPHCPVYASKRVPLYVYDFETAKFFAGQTIEFSDTGFVRKGYIADKILLMASDGTRIMVQGDQEFDSAGRAVATPKRND